MTWIVIQLIAIQLTESVDYDAEDLEDAEADLRARAENLDLNICPNSENADMQQVQCVQNALNQSMGCTDRRESADLVSYPTLWLCVVLPARCDTRAHPNHGDLPGRCTLHRFADSVADYSGHLARTGHLAA